MHAWLVVEPPPEKYVHHISDHHLWSKFLNTHVVFTQFYIPQISKNGWHKLCPVMVGKNCWVCRSISETANQ
jgi:hypothetical protein